MLNVLLYVQHVIFLPSERLTKAANKKREAAYKQHSSRKEQQMEFLLSQSNIYNFFIILTAVSLLVIYRFVKASKKKEEKKENCLPFYYLVDFNNIVCNKTEVLPEKNTFDRLALGTFGCFGYPDGKVLVAVYRDEEDKEKKVIIGRYEEASIIKRRKRGYNVAMITLCKFESDLSFSELRDLLELHNKKQSMKLEAS